MSEKLGSAEPEMISYYGEIMHSVRRMRANLNHLAKSVRDDDLRRGDLEKAHGNLLRAVHPLYEIINGMDPWTRKAKPVDHETPYWSDAERVDHDQDCSECSRRRQGIEKVDTFAAEVREEVYDESRTARATAKIRRDAVDCDELREALKRFDGDAEKAGEFVGLIPYSYRDIHWTGHVTKRHRTVAQEVNAILMTTRYERAAFRAGQVFVPNAGYSEEE